MDESTGPPCSDKLQTIVSSNLKPPCDRTRQLSDHASPNQGWSSSADHPDHHPEGILLCEIPCREQHSAVNITRV